MRHLLIGILALLPLWANAAELTDRTELEFRGQLLLVYQGECTKGTFTVQKVSRSYQFIGPEGKGLAASPEKAIQQACGETRVYGL
jgi:hypothetical protein